MKPGCVNPVDAFVIDEVTNGELEKLLYELELAFFDILNSPEMLPSGSSSSVVGNFFFVLLKAALASATISFASATDMTSPGVAVSRA